MSGQPYRYFTDPTKFRTEYMESLGLRANLDTMNYDANLTYKQTGQLPAVSQMKDTRSTTEILLDYEKLKIDLIASIAKISSSQFGQMVVQSIIDNPLNVDNKLLIFTAQRIDDILLNIKRNYKYGIKGDENDAEQFVKFTATLYNDKNYLTSNTKEFMNRYGMKSLASNTAPFSQIYQNLVKSGATIKNYISEFKVALFSNAQFSRGIDRNRITQAIGIMNNTPIAQIRKKIVDQGRDIVDYIATLLPLIPTNPNMITAIEAEVINFSQQYDRKTYDHVDDLEQNPYDDDEGEDKIGALNRTYSDKALEPTDKQTLKETRRRINTSIYNRNPVLYPNIPRYINRGLAGKPIPIEAFGGLQGRKLQPSTERNFAKDYESKFDILSYYLDFLNRGLPNENLVMSLIVQMLDLYKNYDESVDSLEMEFLDNFNEPLEKIKLQAGFIPQLQQYQIFKHPVESLPSYQAVLSSVQSFLLLLQNIESAINPSEFWDIPKLEFLLKQIDSINIKGLLTPAQVNPTQKVEVTNFPQNMPNMGGNPPNVMGNIPAQNVQPIIHGNNQQEDVIILNGILGALNMIHDQIQQNGGNDYLQEQLEFQAGQLENAMNQYQGAYGEAFVPEDGWGGLNLQELGIAGEGIKKRRGRPRGSGIARKPISYKESVKAHSVLDKGIMETPRFLKFGKYLVNNHKLHNEDIFALKRMAGGNIVDIPSIKISKNLGGVIKKMLGGAIPTYSDISKLSEPEKAYLHKVSQKSNILDKFDIPAPAKDKEDKDIHIFEVMRGEIMAGNDSKELISKFKTHILKLSRNGTLPKKEVEEILSELM